MIKQENVDTIVMVTNEEENGYTKVIFYVSLSYSPPRLKVDHETI